MKGSKSGGEKSKSLSNNVLTLRQRLIRALSLGIKHDDKKRRKWQCNDVETQILAVRSMSAFVNCISSDLLQHPLVKDTISDMLVSLEGILESGNMTVLSTATDLTAKLVDLVGSSIVQYDIAELLLRLSHLFSSHRSLIALPCAIALNCILAKLRPWRVQRHKEIWEALVGTDVINTTVCALEDYISGIQPFEHFIEMASLLITILWSWPPSRYHVRNNANLISRLGSLCTNPDPSVATAVLQLYSALAFYFILWRGEKEKIC